MCEELTRWGSEPIAVYEMIIQVVKNYIED